jgi:hypothetical protein
MAWLPGVHPMMRIITEVFKMPSGSIVPLIYAAKENGQVDRAITDTLCDFVSHLFPPADRRFEYSLVRAIEGKYLPPNPLLADFGVNDINVWVVTPNAGDGNILISNENIPEFSSDEGEPQKFSIQQFHATWECWKRFQQNIRENGAESIVGVKCEKLIP